MIWSDLKVCIVASWAFSLIWASLQLGSRHGYVLEGFLTSCSFDYLSRDDFTRIFMMSMIAGGFLLPLVFLLTFLVLTKRSLDSYSKNFENQFRNSVTISKKLKTTNHKSSFFSAKFKPSFRNGAVASFIEDSRLATAKKSVSLNPEISFQKRHNKVIRTILLYVIAFTIAWTP